MRHKRLDPRCTHVRQMTNSTETDVGAQRVGRPQLLSQINQPEWADFVHQHLNCLFVQYKREEIAIKFVATDRVQNTICAYKNIYLRCKVILRWAALFVCIKL